MKGFLYTEANINEVKSWIESAYIVGYTKEAVRFTNADDVVEQRLRLKVHIALTDSSGKSIKAKDIEGEASFFLSGPNRKTETAAQEILIDDTARRILESVVEEW